MKELKKEIEQMVFESLGEISAVFMSKEEKGIDIVMPSEALEDIGQNLVSGIMDRFFPPNVKKNENADNKCVCNHERTCHGKSYSINYTQGRCSECKCLNFIMN